MDCRDNTLRSKMNYGFIVTNKFAVILHMLEFTGWSHRTNSATQTVDILCR